MSSPELSVIVPVRLAQKTVRATLQALSDQSRNLPVEIIAMVSQDDPTWASLKDWSAPRVEIFSVPGRSGVPQLRRDGVYKAQASWVAITEDHCLFSGQWVAGLAQEAKARNGAVVGGPVSNGRRTFAGWAQYFTRYSGFMQPVAEGCTSALPGNNAVYPRSTLMENAGLMEEGFWEAEFNQALLAAKQEFWLAPALAVEQHQHRGVLEYLFLRYRHGRCYGARRMAATPLSARQKLYWNVPLIPAVLFLRAARAVFRKRHNRARFLLASPLLLIYFLAWGAGESVGYFLGANQACMDTD